MQRPRGFTLLEFMVTTAVLAVVLSIAIPTFVQIRRNAAVNAAFHGLTTTFAGARLLAVTRNVPVTVCPSQDGRTCRRDRIWDEGWIVFLDPGRNDQPLKGDDIVDQHSAPGGAVIVRSTVGRHWLRYHPSGMSPGTNQTLWICSADRRQVGRIIVNNGGRARSERNDGAVTPCPAP